MKRLQNIILISAVCLFIGALPSFAARRVINPDPQKLKEAQSPTGAPIHCLLSSDGVSYLPGTLVTKGAKTIWKKAYSKPLKKQRKRLKSLKSSGAKKKKIKKTKQKIAEYKVSLQQETDICNGNGDDDPIIPPDPLTPLEREPTEADLKLLLERAAFGHGARSSNVLSTGLAQGLSAAIDVLMTPVTEDSEVLVTFRDYADGELDKADGTDRDENENAEYEGMEAGVQYLAHYTANPFQFKLGLLFMQNTWVMNSDAVDSAFGTLGRRWPLWDYFEDMRDFGFNPDIKALAEDHLMSVSMLTQYDNTANVASGLSYRYAEALLGYMLPGTTDTLGNPRYSFADQQTMAKVLSGWEVVPLQDLEGFTEYLPVFVSSDHATGPHELFSSTGDKCSANRLEDYLEDCAFQGKAVARFYAKKLLEFYLTPSPPQEIVLALADEIYDNDYNLEVPLRKLFQSAIFYADGYRNTVVKHPLEVALSFANNLGLPLRDGTDNNGIERHMRRAGYFLTSVPAPYGYPPSKWSETQALISLRNLYERAFEDVEAPERFFGELGWDPRDYLPSSDEVLSSELIEYAAETMGVEPSEINSTVEAAYQYYALHVRSYPDGFQTDTFNSYDNVNDNFSKGVGIYVVMGMSLPFLTK